MLRSLSILGLAVVVLAGSGPPVRSQDPVDERAQALEQIRGEIARLQSQLNRVQAEASSLAGEVEQTRLELAIQESRVSESRAAQELARAKVVELEARVSELEDALATVRGDLRGRLGALYRLGRGGYLRLVLSLRSSSDALPAIRQLRYFARQDGRALDRYIDTKASLEVEQDELAEERTRVEAWVAEEEARQSRLAEIEARQSRLLARLDAERRSLQTERSALADKERKLSNFLGLLYGRQDESMGGTPIQEFRGVLDWPIRAPVEVPFGPRTDPRYGTQTPHNGVQLTTPPGRDVQAVYPGQVLFAAPFRGYGPTVILRHPDRTFTLYAGLARTRVAVDDVVSLGQVVGQSAETLYFEIRVENRPQDPRLWLRE